ncbi:hypothetical protein HNP89_000933 [Methanococcus maripaludis]|uniref:Uncharacterized protein n=1 Tax=Methanococcus maripaludis TaxID=39152 RepID=A0A7J9P4I1_METMI|nr:hypothetical protein [Methanococcus maripaludis]MBA2852976.1 hypothetical protein [Methanococcus maripaludis]
MAEEIEGDFVVPGQKTPEEKRGPENFDEGNTEGPNEPEEKRGPENTEENIVEKEEKHEKGTPEEEVEADLAPIKQEEREEKTPSESPISFDIPTGRSRAPPENFDEENGENPGRTAGRKKSVHLEKVVNKTIIDILEDLKEIHNSSYQKDVKRTSKKIGENIIYLREILDDNL